MAAWEARLGFLAVFEFIQWIYPYYPLRIPNNRLVL
jgi:hypothetical protein